VADDTIGSLTISHRLLGTAEIVLVHHTDCGMLMFKDDDVKDQITADTGLRRSFA
jgi:carbonic anhydrase